MNALLQFLSGKKTYLTTILIGVLLFGTWQHWWQVPSEIYLALMAAAVAFLRAGIGKGPDDPGPPPAPAAVPSPAAKPPAAGLPLMLALASMALIAFVGCQSTPQKVAYQSAGTAVVTVDMAINLWGAYVAANHPPIAQEQAVKTAYEKYQAAMAVACDAGAVYAATSVTNSAAASQTSLGLQQAISDAGQDLADLEKLITSFGVKLQ